MPCFTVSVSLWVSLSYSVLPLTFSCYNLALENEVYRNPKPSLVDRSVLDFTGDRIVPHDIYVDSAFLKNQVITDVMKVNAAPRVGCRQQLQPRSASPDSDLECMAQTRARIKELEKEAEYLEEAYRNYQHRVMQGASASRTPRKMQSPLLLQCAISRPPLTTQHELLEDNPSSQHSPLSSPRGEKYVKRTGQADVFKNPLTPPHRGASSSRRLSSTPVSKLERDLSNKKISDGKSQLVMWCGIGVLLDVPPALWEEKGLAGIAFHSFVICKEVGEVRGKICYLIGVLLLYGNKYWRSTLREAKHTALSSGSFKGKTMSYHLLQM